MQYESDFTCDWDNVEMRIVGSYMLFVISKAIIMMGTSMLLDIDFWRALILVTVSAVITGVFALWVAHIQTRVNESTHERLERLENQGHDIAGAVGATKRAGDVPPSGEVA